MDISHEKPRETKISPKKKAGRKLLVAVILSLLILAVAVSAVLNREKLLAVWNGFGINSGVKTVCFKGVEVNLADRVGDRYLRASIVVELTDKKTWKEIQAKSYRVQDGIIKVLRSKSVSDLDTGGEITSLKKELLNAINRELAQGKADSVFFEELIIQ